MATSKLMASSSTSQNSDIRCKASSAASPSLSTTLPAAFFHNQQYASKSQGDDDSNPDSNLMTLDRFLENVYADDQAASGNAEITRRDVAGDTAPSVRKTVDDVWREIVEGKRLQRKEAPAVECKEEAMDEMMTLEDFLVKAGAVDEPPAVKIEPDGGSFMFDSPILGTPQHSMEEVVGLGNVIEASGLGRGKRRPVLEPLDKAALQRQRRMIKNRESAARSRERKQAYQVELEAMAVKLEEENEQLLREKAERTKERFNQLMEKVIPVTEKRRPPRALRRVNSMQF